jgi:DNA-binding MarR family transcriptional regulator
LAATSRSRRQEADKAERHAAVDKLTMTAALLYFRMRRAAEEITGEGAQSSGRRSILKSLGKAAPQTVPQMARVRAVSRQHIQKLVNGLLDDRLVELIENPAHKKSKLVRITTAGQIVANATHRREAEILPELSRGLSLEDIETATRVLEHFKSAFEDRLPKVL